MAVKQVDGIIVASHETATLTSAPPDVVDLPQSPLPTVAVDWPECDGAAVVLDLESAGYQATRHLLEHGHRRVGLITFGADSANVSPFNAGYGRALLEVGIEVDPTLVARVPAFDMAAGAQGARQLLELSEPPSAVFSIADMLALGAARAIKAAGLHIPWDMALVGFNDIPAAELVDPPLTTVAAPAREMGRVAMQMSGSLIAGRGLSRRQVFLPVSLVVRGSCGAHEPTAGSCDAAAPEEYGRFASNEAQ